MKIFMCGIGGAGMAPLAQFLSQAGEEIQGFDDHLSPRVRLQLKLQGIEVLERPSVLPPCDLVIYTSAISLADPLLIEAKKNQIPAYRRGKFLAHYIREHSIPSIAVAGSHGKTSVTAFLIQYLLANGVDCSYILGGFFQDFRPSGHFESPSSWLIFELDESDGTLISFSPDITVLTNFDYDHESFYQGKDSLKSAFSQLIQNTKQALFYPIDDQNLRGIISQKSTTSCAIFPVFEGAETIPQDFQKRDEAFAKNVTYYLTQQETLNIPELPKIYRRQHLLLNLPTFKVMADYAHHPTEIAAILKAYPEYATTVIFQPHRFSRTATHLAEFVNVLKNIPKLYLLPTYGAFESPTVEGSVERLHEAILAAGGNSKIITSDQILSTIQSLFCSQKNSYISVIGAGDIFFSARDAIREFQFQSFFADSPTSIWRKHLKFNEPLRSKTTFRIGGTARIFSAPETPEELRELYLAAQKWGIPVWILGNGSNVLFADEEWQGLVISLEHLKSLKWDSKERKLRIGAGCSLRSLVGFLQSQGYGDLNFLSGIPGSVGGAVAVNAGAHGQAIGDYVSSVTLLNPNGEIRSCEELVFQYRQANFPPQSIILDVEFHIPSETRSAETLAQELRSLKKWRQERQPRYPSAGSIFRNPTEGAAGKWIDLAGLKGMRIGDAEISTLHGNFIVNRGQAQAEDVIALIGYIKKMIKLRFKIDLRTEIYYVSNAFIGRL